VIVLAINLLATNLTVNAEPLKSYLWVNRVIITFSNSESNKDRRLLIQQIEQYKCDFRNRDLVHIDVIQGTDQYKRLSQKFLISGDEFKLVLLGKDGEVKLNTNSSDLLAIFSLIETMPMRKREIQNDKCQKS
jgi:hypothetical protein